MKALREFLLHWWETLWLGDAQPCPWPPAPPVAPDPQTGLLVPERLPMPAPPPPPVEVSERQRQRLMVLIKECAEAQHAAAMVIEKGWQGNHRGLTQRVLLERELGHLRAAVELLLVAQDCRAKDVVHYKRGREVRLESLLRPEGEV